MLKEYYKQYIKVSLGVSDASVGHYVTGLNSINTFLVTNNYPITDIFSVKSVDEIISIKEFLFSKDDFVTKNNVGHRMYSSALSSFLKFACEDELFFSNSICEMDIPVKKSKTSAKSVISWDRNQIIKDQSITGANYLCENNKNHYTFLSKKTGKPYMEAHHLIPVHFQSQFDTSIDVYANLICLCPNCHRLLHYGCDNDRKYVAEKLFEIRRDRLKNSGIDIAKDDFLKFVI